MPRNLDIESLVEDAFLRLLPLYLEEGVSFEAWEDVEKTTLTPMVKVDATEVEDEEGTLNLFAAQNVLVTFGVFTSKKIDEDGRTANSIRGQIRGLLNRSDVVAKLNETPGLSVYDHGVIPQGSGKVSEDKLWNKNITARIVARTTV